jgi:hypothetical protein
MKTSSRLPMKCHPRLPLAATLALLAFTYGALAQSAPENTEKFTPLPGFDKSAMDTEPDHRRPACAQIASPERDAACICSNADRCGVA